MIHNINRRKFIELFGCGCCGLVLPSCSTVPITERRQLSIIPEGTINNQASAAYENFRSKTKLITSGKELRSIKNIGKRIEDSVSSFFVNKNEKGPTRNFQWGYILFDNNQVKNAWCIPGGKISGYNGIFKISQN